MAGELDQACSSPVLKAFVALDMRENNDYH